MAYKAFYPSDSEVPEDQREHYAQDASGAWVLQVEGEGWAVENIAGLRSTLGKLKDRSAAAEAQLKAFQAIGRQPADIAAAIAELDDLRASTTSNDRTAELQRQLEQARAASQAQVEKAVAPLQSQLEARTSQVKRLLIDSALSAAIAAEGGSVDLMQPVLSSRIRVDANDAGELVPVVVDGEGAPRYVGSDLRPMTIAEMVVEAKSQPSYAVAFAAPGSSGGGTPQSRSSVGLLSPDQAGTMSMDDYRRARTEGHIT